MPLTVRPARSEDLPRASELVASSINDLCARHGFGPMASVRAPTFAAFSLEDDPRGLWVAEDGGDLRGFAFSWVCDGLWFLAQLFVAPGQQTRGIGGELIERALEQAHATDAPTRALITFSFNTVSQGLYMRYGMFPRCSIYNLSAPAEALRARPDGARLRCAPIDKQTPRLDRLARIDASALGVQRTKHHRFLLDDRVTRGYTLLHAGNADECVGYVYVADGHIGPLAVTHPELAGAAFDSALDLAAQGGAAQVSAFVPASSEAALKVALGRGMRITLPMVLMATRDFGNWTQYLPRNPGFM
jgi:GNAT superfamily N-acetyltransferase